MNLRRRVSFTVRCSYLYLLGVTCGSCFVITMLCRKFDLLFTSAPRNASWEPQRYISGAHDRFTIINEGCSIPLVNPFDDSVKKFVQYPTGMKPCRDPNNALLVRNETKISVRKDKFNYYKITDSALLYCCYRAFKRPDTIRNIRSDKLDSRVEYNDCKNFNDSIELKDEFARISCLYNKTLVYEQFYLSTPKKTFLKHDSKGEAPANKSVYNVLILGIDSVSRLNFYRTMPKTIAYLKDLGVVDLLGYNKVADNTFPNVIPLLLGITDTELNDTCMPFDGATFDNCPFVWERFKKAGYYTALGEDTSVLGTFNLWRNGFIRTPTDYYLHTFIHEAENNVGYNKDFNTNLCMNDYSFYKVLLDYIENLTSTLKNTKLFGFFWEVSMSHDYLNYPMVMDNDYLELFKKFEASNYLSETIVFLMSDHGQRSGDIRSTKQGRLEDCLPFMFILMPHSFRETYSEAYNNLQSNRRRLTTPFDIHATLKDLADLNSIQNNIILKRCGNPYTQNRGISLFLPIPSNRTCEMAGIDDHWCTCLKGTPISKESSEAVEASVNLVKHLNLLMQDHPECARLKLAEILEVTEMEVGKAEKKEVGWREFLVVSRTLPGDGIFEAMLRHDGKAWSLAGTVGRLNLYGEQSRCVHKVQLKLYCYCS